MQFRQMGQKTCSISIDTVGYFARSIEGLQLLTDVFALQDDGPLREISLQEVRIAIMKTPMWHHAGPGMVAAMEKAVSILEYAGVKVEQVAFPPEFDDCDTLKRMHGIVAHSEGQTTFLKEYRLDKSKLHPETRSMVESPSEYTRQELLQARDRYARMRPVFDQIAANYSAIITPSAVDEATLGLQNMGSAAFTWFWTVSGLLRC